MNVETPGQAAAQALAEAVARALRAFEGAPQGQPVRTALPHPFSNLSRAEWARSISLWLKHGRPLLKDLEARTCPACGEARSDYIFDSYDGYPYHECASCRTWFVPLKVTHELFERYFERVPEARKYGDYTDAQAVQTAALDSDRVRFDGYYAALKSCLSRSEPTALDVGCGVANSLAVAAEHGFAAQGVEVNRHAVTLARKLGRKVHYPGEAGETVFDAVTMWETLEHIADPLSALQDACRRLKSDGLLALSVPNLNAPDIRSMRGDSLQIHGGPAWPGHINLWTPATLALLLRRAGFEPLHMAGQFSTNLEELLAYHLGHWSGARDYLRADSPEFDLPQAAKQLANALGPAAVAWQDRFAFAPIVLVLARRADGSSPKGLQAFLEANADVNRRTLFAAYGLQEPTLGVRRRGRSLDLTAPDWRSECTAIDGARLRIEAGNVDPFAYLWRSPSLDLTAGGEIRIRGVILSGGISAGILRDNAWTEQASVSKAGPFELVLHVGKSGPAALVISNNDAGCGAADADIDCAEFIAAT